jgi:membrane protease YdiL (CAAX protease family)
MKFKQNNFRQLLIGIGIAMIVCIICILVLSATNSIKFKGTGFMFYPANKVIKDIIIAFMTCVLAGFAEEISLRGIILNQYHYIHL